MPIGPLMIEHRLIERMIKIIEKEFERLEETKEADVLFIDTAADFIKMYADRCHHGKEEDILFRELLKKEIAPEYKKTMNELIEEHKWGRRTVAELIAAKDLYIKGDKGAVEDIIKSLKFLADFYPKHIEKEDKRFFIPIMGCFTKDEQDAMLLEGYEFDRKLIHEKYAAIVKKLES